MAEVNEAKKSSKGWIIGIIIALIAVGAFMGWKIGGKAKEQKDAATPYNYDLSKYIELGEYKDLPYYTPEVEVTEDEIQYEIDSMLEYSSVTNAVKEGVVEDGDNINIAFVGKIDGEEFDGGTSESFDLTVGETSMIEGFVEGLIGKAIGETVSLDLAFPEDYGVEELNGQPVVFDITINHKNVTTVPELTDDFVKENTEFETVDELKEDIRAYILETKEQEATSEIKSALWEKITNDSNVLQEPEKEKNALVEEADLIEEDYKAQAESYGMEWADFLSMFMGMDEDGFQQSKDNFVEATLKDELITYGIARKENVQFAEKDFEAELAKLLEESYYTEETFQQDYGMTIKEYALANGWKYSMLKDKVMDKIMSYGKEVSQEEFDNFYDTAAEVEAETPEE